ncbi:MAG: M20/M25/M40 family metallo-hydrolase [Spirochaetes bacterium]|nr:M20/M25/M40 family metallo-hydrolase [Spirochaetota bacterium]
MFVDEKHKRSFYLLPLLFLATGIAYSAYRHFPPTPLPENSPSELPSAMRAMKHIQHLAQTPRPVGSVAHARARRYIIDEIKKLGLKAEVQCAQLNDEAGKFFFLKNVIAVLPGYDKTAKSICLTAHYDTTPFGPGAGDDAVGCAVLLETMRALTHRSQLKRNVIFVFTDNEEGYAKNFGTRGAFAFVSNHPIAKKIACTINFDVRGTSGPAYMFEVLPNTGLAIKALAESKVPVRASSLMPSVYKRMPLGSDFSRFMRANIPGWNIAFISGFQHYHNATDLPENISPASLQHMLEYAHGLIVYLDKNMPKSFHGPERQYFNIIGSLFVHYPDFLSPILSFSGFLIFFLILNYKKKLQKEKILNIKAIYYVFLTCIFATIPSFLLTLLMYIGKRYYIVYSAHFLVPAFILIASAISLYATANLSIRFSLNELITAYAFLWGVFSLISLFFMRGGHYLFVWPFLSLVGILALFSFFYRKHPLIALILSALCSLLPLVGWTDALITFYEALSVIFSFVYIFLFTLLSAYIIPFVFNYGYIAKKIAAVIFLIGALLSAYGYYEWSPSPQRPEFTSLSFAYDANANKSYWYSMHHTPDRWTNGYFSSKSVLKNISHFIPDEKSILLCDETKANEHALPTFTIKKIFSNNGKIALKLLYKNRYPIIALFTDRKIHTAYLNGIKLQPTHNNFYLLISGTPDNDPILVLECENHTREICITAIAHNYSIPQSLMLTPMPADMMMLNNIPDFNKRLFKSGETIIRQIFHFTL